MADLKISQLPATTTPSLSDVFPIVSENQTKKISLQSLSSRFGSSTTNSLTSDVSVGAISAAQVIPAGTTLQEFASALLSKIFFPTYTPPSLNVVVNFSEPSEVGTSGLNITTNFNRGSINGLTVNGVWQPNTFQDFRSGTLTGYTILGVNNGTNTSLTSASAIIQEGSNSFTATASYNAGPQPKNSKNVNHETGLFAGTISNTRNITGARRTFFGGDTNTVAPTTSSQIRALPSSVLNLSNGSQFTLIVPAGSRRICFAYPANLRDVTSVAYVQQGNAEQKGVFNLTNVAVNGANNFVATNYKVYTYISGVPFGAEATLNITI